MPKVVWYNEAQARIQMSTSKTSVWSETQSSKHLIPYAQLQLGAGLRTVTQAGRALGACEDRTPPWSHVETLGDLSLSSSCDFNLPCGLEQVS